MKRGNGRGEYSDLEVSHHPLDQFTGFHVPAQQLLPATWIRDKYLLAFKESFSTLLGNSPDSCHC